MEKMIYIIYGMTKTNIETCEELLESLNKK